MASELEADYVTGRVVYFLLRNSVGAVWNGASFVAYATANLATYVIAATEQGTASGFYAGSMPSVAADIYNAVAKERIGGSAAETDPTIAQGNVNWDGGAVGELVKVASTGLDAVLVAGKTLPTALKLIGATTAGKLPSGAGSGQENFQDFSGAAAVDVTVDSSGNRTAIVYH